MDWQSIVKGVAPVIGTLLGGPLVGTGIKALAEVLLPGDPEPTLEKLERAVQSGMTPDQLIALKRIDGEVKVKLAEGGIRLEEIHAGDRDSARKMQTATGSWAPAVLAAVTVLGFFGTLLALVSGSAIMPKEYELLVGGLIGTLGACLTQVFNYFFGSTAGSAAKTDLLAKAGPVK